MSQPKIFRVRRSEPPWGDYGDILIHGMATVGENTALDLERTGPFVPPISQPSGFVVVTSAFLTSLRDSGLTGYEIHPVIKKKITKVVWRKWEPFGSEEMKYPAGNEPENYIERRKHSADAADALGELWYVRFLPGIRMSRDGGYHLLASTWNGADFFVVEGERPVYNYVSETARSWLIDIAGEWVSFQEERVD